MPNTPNGLPYPSPNDEPDGAAQIKALAEALDELVRPRARRMLSAQPADIASATSVPVTTFAPIANGNDSGDGKGLDYAAGKITTTRDMWLSVLVSAQFASSTQGTSRWVELTGWLGSFRQLTPPSGVTCGVVLSVPAIWCAAGTQLAVNLWQNSGGALSPGVVRFMAQELRP